MKIRNGLPDGIQDFADFDEMDIDALEALEGFGNGTYSFAELAQLVGQEEAERLSALCYTQETDDIDSLFDDPTSFFLLTSDTNHGTMIGFVLKP